MAVKKELSGKQWNKIKKELSQLSGNVELICDNYNLKLIVKYVGKLEFRIIPYVNGDFDIEWLYSEKEEAKRFMAQKIKYCWDKNFRDSMTKIMGKEKAIQEGFYKKRTEFYVGWKSFRNMKSHLIKHNKSIELIRIGNQIEYENP